MMAWRFERCLCIAAGLFGLFALGASRCAAQDQFGTATVADSFCRAQIPPNAPDPRQAYASCMAQRAHVDAQQAQTDREGTANQPAGTAPGLFDASALAILRGGDKSAIAAAIAHYEEIGKKGDQRGAPGYCTFAVGKQVQRGEVQPSQAKYRMERCISDMKADWQAQANGERMNADLRAQANAQGQAKQAATAAPADKNATDQPQLAANSAENEAHADKLKTALDRYYKTLAIHSPAPTTAQVENLYRYITLGGSNILRGMMKPLTDSLGGTFGGMINGAMNAGTDMSVDVVANTKLTVLSINRHGNEFIAIVVVKTYIMGSAINERKALSIFRDESHWDGTLVQTATMVN